MTEGQVFIRESLSNNNSVGLVLLLPIVVAWVFALIFYIFTILLVIISIRNNAIAASRGLLLLAWPLVLLLGAQLAQSAISPGFPSLITTLLGGIGVPLT